MNKKEVSMILAMDGEKGIGKNNTLPWKIPKDMKYFQKITSQTIDSTKKNVVIMGRKTWDSIPEFYRPLSNRLNIVLSRSPAPIIIPAGVEYYDSLYNAIQESSKDADIEQIFIIGGAQIYNMSLTAGYVDTLYITQVDGNFECDTFFSEIPESFILESESEKFSENNIKFIFKKYIKKDEI